MLTTDEKNKIQEYLKKTLQDIRLEIDKNIRQGAKPEAVINRTINLTVNKLAAQSKALMSSAYNMMMDRTLKEDPFFADSKNKAAFYEANILNDMSSRVAFHTPKEINYKKDYSTINSLIVSGSVVAVGCVVGVTMSSLTPVAIAAVLAGIMGFVVLKAKGLSTGSDINQLIREYLDNVLKSFMLWIDQIENFYDTQVAKLKQNSR